MGTLAIAIGVWTGVAIFAFVWPKIIGVFDEVLPPVREANIPFYGLLAVWLSCVAALAIIFYVELGLR